MGRAVAILSLLSLPLIGCAHHMDEARAEYHYDRADRDWHTGHPIGALKEEHRAHKAEHEAEHDRF